jgi:hypothetical protein
MMDCIFRSVDVGNTIYSPAEVLLSIVDPDISSGTRMNGVIRNGLSFPRRRGSDGDI